MKMNYKRVCALILICMFVLSACGGGGKMNGLLFERDDIQEVSLFYSRLPLYELYVGTTEEERNDLLDKLYEADMSTAVEVESVAADSTSDMVETLRYWKIRTDSEEKELNVMNDKDAQYLVIRDGLKETTWKVPADTFDFITLRQLTTDVWKNTEDPDNSGRVSVEGGKPEIKATKENTAYAVFHMDHILAEKESVEFDGEIKADMTLNVGDVIYSIERSTGRFCRQDQETTAYGQLDEQTLGSIEFKILRPYGIY